MDRTPREYASPAEIRSWAKAGVKRLGSQLAFARAVGLAVYGPIHAASKGRPLSVARFEYWQSRLAAHKPTATVAAKGRKAKAAPKRNGVA